MEDYQRASSEADSARAAYDVDPRTEHADAAALLWLAAEVRALRLLAEVFYWATREKD